MLTAPEGEAALKKVREELFRRFQENPDDEIAQLYYHTFMSPGKENASFQPKEYYVAIGKGNPELTVLTRENKQLVFKNIAWGLKWSYTNREGKTTHRELLNSTCEKVFWQHKDIIYQNRCVVPIDGYYEFYHFQGDKYPHFLYPKGTGLFYAGGIWDTSVNKDTGEVSETLSIITTPPNAITGKLHNNPKAPNGPRMLLLIHPDKVLDFLDPELRQNEIKSYFQPFEETKMQYHPVVKFLKKENSEYLDSPRVQEQFIYPELVA